MIVELPDGTRVEFPDGTPPEVMQQAISGMVGQESPAETRRKSMLANIEAAKAGNVTISPESAARQAEIDHHVEQTLRDPGGLYSLILGGQQGATFGFGDEIIGGVDAGVGAVGDLLSGNFSGIGERMGDRYASTRDDMRQRFSDAEFSRPKATMVGQIAGGLIPSSAVTLPAVAARAGLAGKAAVGGLTGAAEGGLYGFGAAEGGVDDRLSGAASGAALGGIVGAAAPLAIAGVGKVLETGRNIAASALNVPSDLRASKALKTYLERSGMTADDVQRLIDDAAAEGQPQFMVADALGPTGQRALSGIARQPGNARQEIADLLTQRQGGQGNRLSGFISDALDAPDTAAERIASLTAGRKSAADAAYDAARNGASPVDVRGAIQAIDDRIGPMQGSGIADDAISSRLSGYRARLATSNSPKFPGANVELSDFDKVLALKQQIGDDIGAAVRAGRNNEARELGKVQSALDMALEDSSAGYRAANDGFAKASRAIDAVDEGKAATSSRIRAEDTTRRYGGLPDDAKSSFKAGYADPLIARIDAAAPGVNKARPLMSDKSATELGAMANDPSLLGRQIGRENTMFETANSALGGSRTADNLADITDANSISASGIASVLSGGLKGLAIAGADRLLSGAKGLNPATREQIAKMLLSKNPTVAIAPAVKAAAKAGTVNDILSLLIRSTSRGVGQ